MTTREISQIHHYIIIYLYNTSKYDYIDAGVKHIVIWTTAACV